VNARNTVIAPNSTLAIHIVASWPPESDDEWDHTNHVRADPVAAARTTFTAISAGCRCQNDPVDAVQ